MQFIVVPPGIFASFRHHFFSSPVYFERSLQTVTNSATPLKPCGHLWHILIKKVQALASMDVQEIKKRLRTFGKSGRGVEARRMSALTGISIRTIRRYLDPDDNIVPSLGFISAVCRHYGLSMDQVVFSGNPMADTDTDHKWSVFVSWWSANLSQDEKESLMLMTETVWKKALDRSTKNSNLANEINNPFDHKIP